MRVAITGATGSVGRRLVATLAEGGHEPLALTRSAEKARAVLPAGTGVRETDIYSSTELEAALAGCDGVVHLAGESIFSAKPGSGRWSKKHRQAIYDSRVVTARAIVHAIGTMARRPSVLLSASAVGFYGSRPPEEAVDEDTVDAGPSHFAPSDFLGWVCRDWENAADDAERYGVRVVRARFGLVLFRGEGVLGRLETPFKMFVGGPIGSGKPVMSWIHHADLTSMIRFALERSVARGPMNAVAPNPVSNREFSAALGRALHRPSWLPVPPFALRVALGKVASILKTGQRVLPKRAREWGFAWRHPTIDQALAEIYAAPAPTVVAPAPV
jgi:uncharacterized protein (TIGR01777 family)